MSVQLNDKEHVGGFTDLLADWHKRSAAYSVVAGGNLFGNISAFAVLRKFNKQLNAVYKEHFTMKLSHRRTISFQNDSLDKMMVKDLCYVFGPINFGFREGKIRHSELTTGAELQMAGDCCVVYKSQHLESLDLYGGFGPILMLLTMASSLR